jgi:hypothetical protein
VRYSLRLVFWDGREVALKSGGVMSGDGFEVKAVGDGASRSLQLTVDGSIYDDDESFWARLLPGVPNPHP